MSSTDCSYCQEYHDKCPFVRPPFVEERTEYHTCLVKRARDVQAQKDFIDIASLLKVKELYKKAPEETTYGWVGEIEEFMRSIDDVQMLLELDTTGINPNV